MKKRVLGILIALIMALGLLPAGAMAAEPEDQVVTSQQNTVLYYDANGNAVNTTSLGAKGSVVELKKWVEGTKVENEFVVNLQVRTTQDIRELKSDTPDAAAMLILDVSNSMNYCAHCSATSSHRTQGYGHTYVSRLAQAKSAAIQFLDDFAANTGAEEGDARYVAIVDFGSMAARRLNWVDVTNAAQLASAKAVINNLTVAHSGTSYDAYDNGGTNMEAALMLGANLWNSNNTVKAIDYKYTIMLTDGNPTYHVSDNANSRNSSTAIYGTQGNSGNVTEYADAKDVGTQAKRILDLGSLSKLYSICYGNGVWDNNPFGNWNQASPATTTSMTVGQWLEAFSTQAYDGQATGLFDSFDSIVTQIQLASQAWKVNDIMGPYAVYGGEIAQSHNNKSSFADGKLEWDVLSSNTSSVKLEGTAAVLTYHFKYKVTLDNLNSGFNAYTDNDATLTNNEAKLQYAVLDSDGLWKVVPKAVEFPKPTVKAFKGNLTFKKVTLNAQGEVVPLKGMQFQLIPVGSSATGATWSHPTVTSADDGTVTFSNIPSGQDYYLKETGKDGYVALGELPVSVDWEQVTCSALTADTNGNLQLMNEKTDKWVNLTLSKKFEGTVHPESIRFTITNEAIDYYNEVTLSEANSWTTTLYGLKPGNYVIYEDAAMDGYNVTVQATLDGQPIETNYGNVHATFSEPSDPYDNHTVVFTNKYTQKVGSLKINKSFWEREHEDLIADSENPDLLPLDPELYANKSVTIQLLDANGDVYTQQTLPQQNGSWELELTNVPIGEYTIKEVNAPSITDREFVHGHIEVNGAARDDGKITVGEDTSVTIALENHYTHDMGDIRVAKTLSGMDVSVVPEDHIFLIDVYEATDSTTATGNLVTTINVKKLVNGELVGQSVDLPVGWYYLVERASSTTVDGYNFISGVFDDQFIQVVKGTTSANVILTNTYQQQKGTLTVSKEFIIPEGYEDSVINKLTYINVLVLDSGNKTVATLRLEKDNSWTASVELPLGTYYLSEIVAEGAAGSADVPTFGLNESWDNATVTITADNQQLTRKVTNTYTKNYGELTLNKAFEGITDELKDKLNITFIVYNKATNQQAAVVNLPDATTGSWSKTIALPVGEYYLVERGAQNALNDDHYTFTGLEIDNAEVDLVNGYSFSITGDDDTPNMTTLNATNIYKKDQGSLTINKAFAQDSELQAAAFANKSIAVQIMRDGAVLQTVKLNANNGWSVTVPNLEAGVIYTLVEVHTEGAEDTAFVKDYDLTYSWSEGAQILLTKNGATNTVTNSYKKQTGTMVVRKFFSGVNDEDRAALNKATVSIAVKDDTGATVRTITLNNSNNWYSGIITLPVGTYELEETEIAIDGYEHTDAGFVSALHPDQVIDQGKDSKKATINVKHGANNGVRVQLTNTMRRKTGTLVIEKQFAGDFTAANFPNSKIDVLVKRNGALYQKVTLTANAGWEATLTNVPTGTYQVEEVTGANETNTAYVANHGLHVTYTNQGTVEIEDNDSKTMTITNEYQHDVGYIKFTKRFAAGSQDTLDAAAKIGKIAIRVKDQYGNVEAVKYVSHEIGATVTFGPLPAGYTYTVEEEILPNAADTAWVDGYTLTYNWTVGDGTVLVVKDQTAEASVTNTYTRDMGYIQVSKNVVGLTEPEKAAKAFKVFIKQNGVTVDTLTLNTANNWMATSKALPTGDYVIEEDQTAAAVTNYNLKVEYTPKNVTVGKENAATPVEVRVTNTYTRKDAKYLEFDLVKQVEYDKDEPAETIFNFKLTAQFATPWNLRSLSIPDNEVQVWYNDSQLTPQADGSYLLSLKADQNGATGKVRIYANADEIRNLTVMIEEVKDSEKLDWTYSEDAYTISQNQQGHTVILDKEGNITTNGVLFTNTHKDMPRLAITKTLVGFDTANAADVPEQLTFEITGGSLTEAKKVVLKPDVNGDWTTTLSDLLPGIYTVTELDPDLPYYDVATTVSGNVTAVPGTTRAAQVELAYDQTAAVNFQNTYTRSAADLVTLNVTKEIKNVGKVPVSKEETFNFAVNFAWKPNNGLMMMSNGIVDPKTVQVQVEGTEGWTTVTVPGTFNFSITTKETVTAKLNIKVNAEDLAKLNITVNEVGGNAKFWAYDTAAKDVVLANNVGNVTITNTYDENLTSVTIPVTKTVVQAGNIATGINTFYFEASPMFKDAAESDRVSGMVKLYVKAAKGYEGKVVDLGNERFSITVNGADAAVAEVVIAYPESAVVDGIIIRELAGAEDKLNKAELAEANWTYDASAFKDPVEDQPNRFYIYPWIVELTKDGKIIRNPAGEKVSEVNITNTYTANTPPPQTGDDSNIALWLSLMGASVVGIMLISKRRKTC